MLVQQWMQCWLLEMCSYALHFPGPKKPVRSNEQYKNHDQVGSNLVNSRAEEAGDVAFVTGSQVLHQANNNSTHDGPGNRVNTAQDDGREGQQCRASQRWVHRKGTNSKKNPADGGHGGGNTPCQRINHANVDTHRQRSFLVRAR